MSEQGPNDARIVCRLDSLLYSKIWKAPYDICVGKSQIAFAAADHVSEVRYGLNSSIMVDIANRLERENGTFDGIPAADADYDKLFSV